MEKRGIAYCADEFAEHRDIERTVYACPVFAAGNAAQETLPLVELYDHPDFIDVISAVEFGLEQLFPDRTLLCILVSQALPSLDEMEQIMIGTASEKKFCVGVQPSENTLTLTEKGKSYTLPQTDRASQLLSELSETDASAAACLAAVAQWCVGYKLHFYLPQVLAL